MTAASPDPRRRVPRTDRTLADPRLREAAARWAPHILKQAVVTAQERVRAGEIDPDDVVNAAIDVLPRWPAGPRRVVNATGVVLHTNLGRAPLGSAAVAALVEAAGYADVEFDLETGQRARRGRGTLDALQQAVPAAESVLVVNNGAAALVLATTALAAGREVVVSRGELIEIGDGFRLPDLIASTGARLREVGTTNRARLDDYADAVGPQTGCLLKVHPSNFVVHGFTSGVEVGALAGLGPPVVVDIGSGLLGPDSRLPDEPDADTALRAGAAVVTASGDKLLGGPQAGLVLGRATIVEQLRRHPLARALRIDKLTAAALEATLRAPGTPTGEALRADPEVLRERVLRLTAALREVGAEAVPSDGVVGGGGAPGVRLPGWAVALPVGFAARLRTGDPPVVGRVDRDRCLLDLRCVSAADDATVRSAVLAAAERS